MERIERSGLRRAVGLALALLAVGLSGASDPGPDAAGGVLGFTLARIDGTPEPLADYRGRVLLLVNVASKCGYTRQYGGLEALYERYRAQGFAVLGFPSNDFRGQEPGTNAEIAEFCRSTWGVRFPMFAKLAVQGDEAHPLYRYLTGLPEPIGGRVEWNFQKYLVDRRGVVVAKFAPRTEPEDTELVRRIEALLAEAGPKPGGAHSDAR
jgi:glutathione peroxidase